MQSPVTRRGRCESPRVVFCGRNRERGEDTAIKAKGCDAEIVLGNLSTQYALPDR